MMSRKLRQLVYEKYDGKCGYSGQMLPKGWQVDHIIPKCHYGWGIAKGNPDNLDNLMPTFSILNYYKKNMHLEEWRRYLITLSERLRQIPKTIDRAEAIRRKEVLLTGHVSTLWVVADLFNISEDRPFSGTFYFETYEPDPGS